MICKIYVIGTQLERGKGRFNYYYKKPEFRFFAEDNKSHLCYPLTSWKQEAMKFDSKEEAKEYIKKNNLKYVRPIKYKEYTL